MGLVGAALLPWTVGAPAHGAAPVVPCSRGLVALTFDDGPSPTVTPSLVRLLRRARVPATFFMVGTSAAAHPGLVRMVDKAGFAIGNHTWAHEDLTTLSDAGIRHAVRATHQALVRAGVRPSHLARPPYGAIDDRVRGVLTGMGYAPVLWSIDPRDWDGATTPQIEQRVVGAVGAHRANVVLQHDGVANSPATLRAVGTEIRTLRARGYCFGALDDQGEPTPPVPTVSVTSHRHRVAEGDLLRLAVRLDRPTSRPTTVRLRSEEGRLSRRMVRLGVGRTVARVGLRLPQDRVDEHGERVAVQVVGGRGVRPGRALDLHVVDDDPAPAVRLGSTRVTASPVVSTIVSLPVRLDRVTDRGVAVTVSGPLGRAVGRVDAGSRTGEVLLTVPVGSPADTTQQLTIHVVRVTHATPSADGTVEVSPPTVDRLFAEPQRLPALGWGL